MMNKQHLIVFGEVLFDCFPNGEQVLGGAPFNVAWHLQAFGDQPCFVSRVGDDLLGNKIISAMTKWGMDIESLQIDVEHSTGRVDVALIDDEPHYTITEDCAYDFIDVAEIKNPTAKSILYHGTLALRNTTARHAYEKLADNPDVSIFLDVNLRAPWWQKDEVSNWLKRARWVKLNQDELKLLGVSSGDIQHDMAMFQEEYNLELLIVTRGAEGAVVRNREGELHSAKPPEVLEFVDTVGAGDAFTAVFLHGLLSEWPIAETVEAAQQFASAVVGLRGATSSNLEFYSNINRRK